MSIDSLDDLKAAFREWRRTKQYISERIPAVILRRAQRAAATHGITRVIEATGVEHKRLVVRTGAKRHCNKGAIRRVPSFSRMGIVSPAISHVPVAEAESASGMKLRVFSATAEAMSLLSSFCAGRGVS